MTESGRLVINVLRTGWKSSEELSRLTGLGNRALRSTIHDLRMEDYPIVSENTGGYRLAKNKEDSQEFRMNIKHRKMELIELEFKSSYEWDYNKAWGDDLCEHCELDPITNSPEGEKWCERAKCEETRRKYESMEIS